MGIATYCLSESRSLALDGEEYLVRDNYDTIEVSRLGLGGQVSVVRFRHAGTTKWSTWMPMKEALDLEYLFRPCCAPPEPPAPEPTDADVPRYWASYTEARYAVMEALIADDNGGLLDAIALVSFAETAIEALGWRR